MPTLASVRSAILIRSTEVTLLKAVCTGTVFSSSPTLQQIKLLGHHILQLAGSNDGQTRKGSTEMGKHRTAAYALQSLEILRRSQVQLQDEHIHNGYHQHGGHQNRIQYTNNNQNSKHHQSDLYKIHHGPRQQLINGAHILGEAIQNPSRRSGVKESHGGVQDAGKHAIVQHLGGMHANLKEQKATERGHDHHGDDQSTVYVHALEG